MKKEVTTNAENKLTRLELKLNELQKRVDLLESILVGKGPDDYDDEEYLIDTIVD